MRARYDTPTQSCYDHLTLKSVPWNPEIVISVIFLIWKKEEKIIGPSDLALFRPIMHHHAW
jgi:hypothetical protein